MPALTLGALRPPAVCFELCDFNLNGWLSPDELVRAAVTCAEAAASPSLPLSTQTLMLRCTLCGLMKLLGDTSEPPSDSYFEEITKDALRVIDQVGCLPSS